MATGPMQEIVQHLRRSALLPDGAGMSDGALLERFVTGQDEAALEVLVRRHGPMVWGVCRRVVSDHHDAEDAFQATFLVLVRRAAAAEPRERVGNWLYGVAHQTARNARAAAARRRTRERQVADLPEPAAPASDPGHELRPVLDQELSRLPEKYRSAIVLCDLEGKSRKDVARQFGVPEGTMSGRLTRGRALLAKRPARHGLAISGAALAAALAPGGASAAVAPSLLANTVHAADLVATGSATATVAPAAVAALSEGVLRTMVWTKLKVFLAGLLILSAVGVGAGLVEPARADKPAAQGVLLAQERPADKPDRSAAPRSRTVGSSSKFTLGKETTYITAPLDGEGYPNYETALNERLRRDITPDKNANALLWQALGPQPQGRAVLPEFFRWLQVPAPPARGAYLISLAQYGQDNPPRNDGKPADDLFRGRAAAAGRPWVAQNHPELAGWLKANEKPLAVALEATRRPEFYSPLLSRKSGEEGWYGLLGAIMPSAQAWRELGTTLAVRAMLHAGEGRFDDAWQDLLACHRLGRLLARDAEPTVYQIGVALDQLTDDADLALLDRARPNATLARAWPADLQRLPPLPPVADWFDCGGRFTYLDSVLQTRRHGTSYLRVLRAIDPRPQPRHAPPALGAGQPLGEALDWDAIMRTGNAWSDRMAAAHRIPDHAAREQEFDRLEQEARALEQAAGGLARVVEALRSPSAPGKELSQRLADSLVGFYLQGLRQVRRAADRAEQRQRNLYLAFALAAYHGDHGRYPEELTALVPGYLAKVPNDLFSGRALPYRPAENGYLLYCVGVNGRDEGRRGTDDTPPGDDLRVRMPLPEPKPK